MRFLLSIHDVWPGNLPVVEEHWQRLRSMGARRIALLVVPFYHGLRGLQGEDEFLGWLREKASAGSEILLHGYRHLMPERVDGDGALRAGRSAWGRWVNKRLVAGEAEFCGLPASEREVLLRSGAEAMARAGFPAHAFVAPTWHGGPPESSLRSLGFTLQETRFRLHHIPSGRSRFAPPLSWTSDRGESRLAGGKAWLESLIRLPLMKVALHPGDLAGSGATRILERVFSSGRETAYREVFPLVG